MRWIFGVWILLSGAVAQAAAPSVFLQSGVDISGYVDATGCIRHTTDTGFDCSGGGQQSLYGNGDVNTSNSTASVSDSVAHPTDPNPLRTISSASARARTDVWINRADARAHGETAHVDDIFGNFTLRAGVAEGSAISTWGSPLVVTGGTGFGFATLKIRLTGDVSVSGPNPVAAATVTYSYFAGPAEMWAAGVDLSPALQIDTGGTFDQLVNLPFVFQYGVPLQFVGALEARAHAFAYFEIIDQGSPTGDGDFIAGSHDGSVAVDFFSTAQAVQLVVPAGASAFGDAGTLLPFAVVAVPEPRTYALFFAGLGLVALAVRRRASPRRT
jgi:hypothetical protein